MLVLKWAMVYGSLQVDDYETLDRAVSAAHYASNEGMESLRMIEVLNDDGTTRVYNREECDLLMQPLEDAETDAWKHHAPIIAIVEIALPADGKRAQYEGHLSLDAAEKRREELAVFLGDRVTVRRV